MKTTFTSFLLLIMLSISMAAWAQVPTITVPVDGATGISLTPTITAYSASTGNSVASPENISIEIHTDPLFTSYVWGSTPLIRDNDVPATYDFVVDPATLSSGVTYYVRAVSDVSAEGPGISFTTIATPITGTNFLGNISSALAPAISFTPNGTTGSVTRYPNRRSFVLTLSNTIPNATQYEIEFDTTSSAFTNVVDRIVINGTSTSIRVDAGWLSAAKLSGSTVWVRSRGINSGGSGPWTPSLSYKRFGFPLQPCKLITPTGAITRNAFKLWTTKVGRGSRYYFQVSTSPTFASSYSLTGSFASLNETVSGITGNVFRHNYEIGDANRAFNYLSQLTNNTTYYVRVRAWNSTQTGYWADTLTITPTPTLTSGFRNVTTGATGQPTAMGFLFIDNPNFTETSFDFQLSTNAAFTSILSDQPGLTTLSAYVPGLSYNTTYWARIRSNVVSPASQSAWVTVSFTTKTAPSPTIWSPTASQVWPKLGVFAYATWESGITQYNWDIEKLNAPTSSASFTSTTYGRNFRTYLVAGGSYRIRVTGVASGLTGSPSAWVNFTVSAAATAPAVGGPSKAYTAAARFGDAEAVEPVAYPNPFTDKIMLTLPKNAVSYQVSDISGRLVETNAQATTVQEVGASWPQGTYLVRVQTSDGSQKHLKVIKQ